jgi:hypothetical protein
MTNNQTLLKGFALDVWGVLHDPLCISQEGVDPQEKLAQRVANAIIAALDAYGKWPQDTCDLCGDSPGAYREGLGAALRALQKEVNFGS